MLHFFFMNAGFSVWKSSPYRFKIFVTDYAIVMIFTIKKHINKAIFLIN